MTVTDFADWNTAQEHASKIAITGAPLLTLSGNVVNATSVTLTSGVSTILATVPITQLGYEIWLDSWVTGLLGSGVYDVTMTWKDSVSGQIVTQETWEYWPATVQGSHVIRGTGPTKGDTLVLSVLPVTTATTIKISAALVQNSRINARDDWRSFVWSNLTPGVANPNASVPGLLLAESAVAINAASSTIRQMPLYAGKATLHLTTTSGLADAHLAVTDVAGIVYADIYADSHGRAVSDVTLWREQSQLTLFNDNAAAKTITAYLIAAQY